MARVKVTNLIKLATIIHLYNKPMHGYELIKRLEAKMERKISASQVYPFLGQLSKKGLVTHDRKGSREKKSYSLTNEGKVFVKKTINKFGELIDTAISNNLHRCYHCGCDVYKGGYAAKIKGKKRVFCCKYCAQGCK